MLAVVLKEGTEFSPGRGRGFLGGPLLQKFCASTEGAPKMLPLPQGGHRKLWASVNKDPRSQDVNSVSSLTWEVLSIQIHFLQHVLILLVEWV